MFGTSGIRGIYGRDVTEELAGKIANVFAERTLAVGRDLRKSGVPLSRAVVEGAQEAGSDIIELGIVPTPTLALATSKHACRGIMVTASHNPPEYNGLKLIEAGKEIGKDMEKEVVMRYNGARKGAPEKGGLVHDSSVLDGHKAMVTQLVDTATIARKRPKVLVDCNGAAAVITPYLLTDLGCRVTSLNASTECFNRPSEPSAENLAYLSELVRRTGADFAIAHDGDGDRCAVIDDEGGMLPLDVQLAIMITHELEGSRNKRVVSTVEASLVVRDVVENAGGRMEITPVGSTYVGDRLEATGALFGGEPCGEYIYAAGVHVPDAVLAAAKFAEIFCRKGPLSELRKHYKQNFMVREKFQAKGKNAAMAGIKKAVDASGIEGTVRSDDGIRVDENDGWFLIRASGTEPIIRLTMEYKTKEKLGEREKELRALIMKNLWQTVTA